MSDVLALRCIHNACILSNRFTDSLLDLEYYIANDCYISTPKHSDRSWFGQLDASLRGTPNVPSRFSCVRSSLNLRLDIC
jgi:hypothetical protein